MRVPRPRFAFVGRFRRGLAGSGRTLIKLLVFAGVCVGLFAYFLQILSNSDYLGDYTGYQAELTDVTGLVKDDTVKIGGVAVGKVTGIGVERGKALVRFEIKSDMVLREGTRVGVRFRNILGQKYLYVYPAERGPAVDGGHRFPVSQSIDSADVGEFLNAAGPILQSIDPAQANAIVAAVSEGLAGNEQRVRNLLSNAAGLSDTVGSLDTEVGRVVDNLDLAIGALAQRDADLNQVITNLQGLSGTLGDHNDDLVSFVDSFTGLMTEVNRLLTENRGDIDATIGNLVTVTDMLRQNRSNLEQTLIDTPGTFASLHQFTRVGQWFNFVQSINCIANQRLCNYADQVNEMVDPSFGTPDAAAAITALPLAGAGP